MSKKNSQFTHGANPTITMPRTRHDLSYDRLMSCNLGTLYPFYFEEILPGDSFKVKSSIMSRLSSSFLKPAFANIFLDTYYFFVPARLCYDKFPNVFGENTEGHWANTTSYNIPLIPVNFNASASEHKIAPKSVADYFALPPSQFVTSGGTKYVSALPFRAFALIYNEWFRDENYIDPVAVSKGELNSLSDEYFNSSAWSVNNYTGMLPKVSKFHDFFTSLLPSPQKGNAVEVLAGGSSFLPLKVNPSGEFTWLGGDLKLGVPSSDGYNYNHFPLYSTVSNNASVPFGTVLTGQVLTGDNLGQNSVEQNAITRTNVGIVNPLNQSLSVNDLRLAFQTQRVLERDARGGTRYIEMIKSAFGVSSPDARLQRPEFLGGKRLSIGISQVAQTSSGTENSALGSLGGYSLSDGISKFSKAFVEHGYVIGVMCYRQYHSYSQGIDERFTRSSRFDFYDPAFAYIGETPVKRSVLYAGASDDDILGYAPAWSSYRYHNNEVVGQMRSQVENSLDIWHVGDEYANAPTMNQQFLSETPDFLNRVITVDSSVQDQFILNIFHYVDAVRVLPPHSRPGLIDHY